MGTTGWSALRRDRFAQVTSYWARVAKLKIYRMSYDDDERCRGRVKGAKCVLTVATSSWSLSEPSTLFCGLLACLFRLIRGSWLDDVSEGEMSCGVYSFLRQIVPPPTEGERGPGPDTDQACRFRRACQLQKQWRRGVVGREVGVVIDRESKTCHEPRPLKKDRLSFVSRTTAARWYPRNVRR